MIIYRPPSCSNLDTFFSEITISLTKASCNYQNFIIIGDINTGLDKLLARCQKGAVEQANPLRYAQFFQRAHFAM